jgi:hypothetical protein
MTRRGMLGAMVAWLCPIPCPQPDFLIMWPWPAPRLEMSAAAWREMGSVLRQAKSGPNFNGER